MTNTPAEIDYSYQAKVLGYYPYIRFSPLEYLTVVEMHGTWGFDHILSRLGNPAEMHRYWAVRILGAASYLSRDELSEAPNLYQFITSSESWRRDDEHKRTFWAVFFKVYRHIKSAHKTMPPDIRRAYKQDLARWQRRLIENRSKAKLMLEQQPQRKDSNRRTRAMKPEPVIVYKRKERQE